MNAANVRALIARAVLGDAALQSPDLGNITLQPHQLVASRRLSALLHEHGGALLADPVGMGKTYTALGVARSQSDVLVIAPASLHEMWRDALRATAMSARVVSHESLSRGGPHPTAAAFVIIDEAHRLRNPSTRRYAAVADLCSQARVLLLSATPIQNSRNDLAAQLALFLGRRAWSLDDDALGAYIVRDAQTDERSMPDQIGPVLITLEVDDDCVDELISLPPPIPARDESVAAALLTFSLVHQWTSSRGALVASLRRRRTRALAMLDALASGQRPSRAELAAWTHLGDAMQLAFPELVIGSDDSACSDLESLRSAVGDHLGGVERLVARLSSSRDPDECRAAALRDIRQRHAGERIIAFCHYAETVAAFRRIMSSGRGIAALTARGGRVAGGCISRADVLRQFSPGESEQAGAAERIDLLLTTDVLSEGLNLQAASVVVHLDLPWNPARLEQRVGRVRRLGSAHSVVSVYTLAAPASAERLLRIDERLRDKLRAARKTVGIAGQILPSPVAPTPEPSRAEVETTIRRRLQSWLAGGVRRDVSTAIPSVAACQAKFFGYLAAISDGTLVANLGDEPTTSRTAINDALRFAEAPQIAIDRDFLERVVVHLDTWLDHRRGSAAVDFSIAVAARSRRAALARVSRTLARAPRHRRAQLASLAEAARNVASARLAEGAERVLDLLVRADLPDEAWLRSLAAFGELNVRKAPSRDVGEPSRVVAIILFQEPPL